MPRRFNPAYVENGTSADALRVVVVIFGIDVRPCVDFVLAEYKQARFDQLIAQRGLAFIHGVGEGLDVDRAWRIGPPLGVRVVDLLAIGKLHEAELGRVVGEERRRDLVRQHAVFGNLIGNALEKAPFGQELGRAGRESSGTALATGTGVAARATGTGVAAHATGTGVAAHATGTGVAAGTGRAIGATATDGERQEEESTRS